MALYGDEEGDSSHPVHAHLKALDKNRPEFPQRRPVTSSRRVMRVSIPKLRLGR
jgi:hypothetical protein